MGLVLEIVNSTLEVRGSRFSTKSDLDYSQRIRSEYYTLRCAFEGNEKV